MKYTINILLMLLLSSCIDEYSLPKGDLANYQNEIVVEGRILSDAYSFFYVSRTKPLSNSASEDYVTNAQVTIISEDGKTNIPADYLEKGEYAVYAGKLSTATNYAVRVVVNGDTYQSKFQPLLQTPKIESVNYVEQPGEVSMQVSTDGENASKYYMWSYEEDWKIHPLKDLNDRSEGLPIYKDSSYPNYTAGNYNPYYTCYCHTTSSNVLIYSTANLNYNRVSGYELVSIPIDDQRISNSYSMLLKQWSLSEEAYEYYRLMKLYTENSNSIFTPMPMDVEGNVECMTDPSKSARGFVIASTVESKRVFVKADDLKSAPTYIPVKDYTTDKSNSWGIVWKQKIESFASVAFSPDGTIENATILYNAECIDCLLQKHASYDKPDFWPDGY